MNNTNILKIKKQKDRFLEDVKKQIYFFMKDNNISKYSFKKIINYEYKEK